MTTTAFTIEGYRITKSLGIVRGISRIATVERIHLSLKSTLTTKWNGMGKPSFVAGL